MPASPRSQPALPRLPNLTSFKTSRPFTFPALNRRSKRNQTGGGRLRGSLGEIIMSELAAISRRGFIGAMLGGAAATAQRSPQPVRPLVPWMYMIYPIEQWLSDYRTTLDAWEAGGVRGLVIGPLVFYK
jgi:hypothetical protein